MSYPEDRLDNAHDVVEWCKKHFASNVVGTSSRTNRHIPHRVFWEISGMYKLH